MDMETLTVWGCLITKHENGFWFCVHHQQRKCACGIILYTKWSRCDAEWWRIPNWYAERRNQFLIGGDKKPVLPRQAFSQGHVYSVWRHGIVNFFDIVRPPASRRLFHLSVNWLLFLSFPRCHLPPITLLSIFRVGHSCSSECFTDWQRRKRMNKVTQVYRKESKTGLIQGSQQALLYY